MGIVEAHQRASLPFQKGEAIVFRLIREYSCDQFVDAITVQISDRKYLELIIIVRVSSIYDKMNWLEPVSFSNEDTPHRNSKVVLLCLVGGSPSYGDDLFVFSGDPQRRTCWIGGIGATRDTHILK
jgi:hypothetical protein